MNIKNSNLIDEKKLLQIIIKDFIEVIDIFKISKQI